MGHLFAAYRPIGTSDRTSHNNGMNGPFIGLSFYFVLLALTTGLLIYSIVSRKRAIIKMRRSRQKALQASLAAIDYLIEREPRRADPYWRKARLLEATGDVLGAARYYRVAHLLSPSDYPSMSFETVSLRTEKTQELAGVR